MPRPQKARDIARKVMKRPEESQKDKETFMGPKNKVYGETRFDNDIRRMIKR